IARALGDDPLSGVLESRIPLGDSCFFWHETPPTGIDRPRAPARSATGVFRRAAFVTQVQVSVNRDSRKRSEYLAAHGLEPPLHVAEQLQPADVVIDGVVEFRPFLELVPDLVDGLADRARKRDGQRLAELRTIDAIAAGRADVLHLEVEPDALVLLQD